MPTSNSSSVVSVRASVVVALLAGFFAMVVGSLDSDLQNTHSKTFQDGPLAELGIEHDVPAGLTLEMGSLQGHSVIDITMESERDVYLSVPDSWERREVRNVPLESVVSDPPSLNFVRWKVPGTATISFYAPSTPSQILLHNVSDPPLKVSLARVNLDTGKVERNVILLQKSSIELW